MTFDTWETLTLGDLGRWVTGSTPPSSDHASKGDDVLFVTPGDVGSGGKLGEVARRISNIGADKVRRIKPGSVILVCIGTIGKVAWTDREITTNQQINSLEVDQTKFDVKFVHWLLASPTIQQQLWQYSTSTTVALINKKTLEKIPCSVPPLDEQRRIVETLDDHLSRLDKALADLDHADSQALDLRRSVLNRLLTNNAAETQTEHAHPSLANWESKSLEEVCSLITDGSHFSPKTSSSGDFPYITVRDIRGNTIDFSNCQFVSETAFGELQKTGCQPNVGDVLFSKDGTVGKVAIVVDNRPFVVLSSLAILRPKPDLVSPVFLAYVLQSPSVLESALGMKTGTAIRRVVLRNLKKLAFPLPPLSDQLRIVEVLDESLSRLDSTRHSISRQKTSIATLRRSLLNQAFNGELGTK